MQHGDQVSDGNGGMPEEAMVGEDQVQKTLDIARKVREQAERHDVLGIIYAAEWLPKNMASGVSGKIVLGEKLAKQVVSQYVQSLLNADQFEAAATVLWGEAVYDWRPHSAQETWRCLFEYDKLLIQGAGAMGKTFNAAAWFLLDWMRDPEYTCVKVVSLTEAHAQRNVFAAIKTFYRTALVRPEFEGSEDLVKSIQANDDDKNGIHLVAVPKGDSGMGTLRGFHPSPRAKHDKKWGRMSRTHVVLDEAEEVPAGVWEGLQNILSAADTEGAKGRIKIFGASNPKDRTSEFGKRCEPVRGWQTVDCEEDFEWESRDGWHVLRLDAARCENVVKRKIVFHGFQTYQGYQAYEARGRTAEYYTMARGWFPQDGIAMGIITPAMMDNAMGHVRFIGPVVPLAAFDLALEGKDQVVCSHGRFGLSDGWTPRSGAFIPWKSPRVVLQLDAQIDFPKKATLEQTDQIIKFCKQMKISPNWLCVDRTGNGAGISDALCSLFGKEVLGVNYSWSASETSILGEDTQRANEVYSGVVTELIFGLARFLEFEYLKISPSFSNEDLVRQAIARRYKQAGQGLVRVESKGDFVKRTRQNSPDQLDSLSLLVYLLRQREGLVATMTEPKKENSFEKPMQSFESMGYVDFSE
jgi:hypothetical protein